MISCSLPFLCTVCWRAPPTPTSHNILKSWRSSWPEFPSAAWQTDLQCLSSWRCLREMLWPDDASEGSPSGSETLLNYTYKKWLKLHIKEKLLFFYFIPSFHHRWFYLIVQKSLFNLNIWNILITTICKTFSAGTLSKSMFSTTGVEQNPSQ